MVKSDSIGARIENLRKKKGETQKELAEAVGRKSRETVNQWENNTREVKGDDIVKLAKHFGVTADYLLGLYSEPTPGVELAEMCNYLGLSAESVELLHEHSLLNFTHYIDTVLSTCGNDVIRELNGVGYLCDKIQLTVADLEDGTPISPEQHSNLYEYRKRLELALFRFSKVCDRIPDTFKAWELLNMDYDHVVIDLGKPQKDEVDRANALADSKLSSLQTEVNNNESSES